MTTNDEQATSRRGVGAWIAAAIAVLLLIWLLVQCGGDDPDPTVAGTSLATASSPVPTSLVTTTLAAPTTTAPGTTTSPTTTSPTTTPPTTTPPTTTPPTTTPPTTVGGPLAAAAGCLAIDDLGVLLVELTPEGLERVVGQIVDADTGLPPLGLAGVETSQLESLAIHPETGAVYTASWGLLGTLDAETAEFTAIGRTPLTDIDGLAFDGRGRLFGASRRENAPDRLVRIDPVSAGAVDIGPITGPDVLNDIDDIAIEPATGQIYGVANNEGDEDRTSVLVAIDPEGDASIVGTDLGVIDIEGLGFDAAGTLWATSGSRSGSALFSVDTATGKAEFVEVLGGAVGDYEAIACPALPD